MTVVIAASESLSSRLASTLARTLGGACRDHRIRVKGSTTDVRKALSLLGWKSVDRNILAKGGSEWPLLLSKHDDKIQISVEGALLAESTPVTQALKISGVRRLPQPGGMLDYNHFNFRVQSTAVAEVSKALKELGFELTHKASGVRRYVSRVHGSFTFTREVEGTSWIGSYKPKTQTRV